MSNRRSILSHFRPPTRMAQILVEELKRCWAKLDGRAATIRRLLADRDAIQQQAIEQSEYIQSHWTAPAEAAGMRREIVRLKELLQHATNQARTP